MSDPQRYMPAVHVKEVLSNRTLGTELQPIPVMVDIEDGDWVRFDALAEVRAEIARKNVELAEQQRKTNFAVEENGRNLIALERVEAERDRAIKQRDETWLTPDITRKMLEDAILRKNEMGNQLDALDEAHEAVIAERDVLAEELAEAIEKYNKMDEYAVHCLQESLKWMSAHDALAAKLEEAVYLILKIHETTVDEGDPDDDWNSDYGKRFKAFVMANQPAPATEEK